MNLRRLAVVLYSLTPLALVAACGARTGLLVPSEAGARDTGADVVDATAPDVLDASSEPDADVADEPDAFDATEEPDTPQVPDGPDICPDAGSTLIYVMTQQSTLLSFYPPTGTFETIGRITCPDPGNGNPFSMAVDRSGVAYVVFESGHLFRVSTRTAACEATAFVPGTGGFMQFGMSFSANAGGDGGGDAGETLYIAADPGWSTNMPMPSSLGSVDTMTFAVTHVGQFTPFILQPELTGTGAGDLFAFWAPTQGSTATIVQIDKTTAQVVVTAALPGVTFGNGWAFAFWGGDFYTFTAPGGSSVVTRYRPSDGTIVQVATTPFTIVGAGVSTCAPQM